MRVGPSRNRVGIDGGLAFTGRGGLARGPVPAAVGRFMALRRVGDAAAKFEAES